MPGCCKLQRYLSRACWLLSQLVVMVSNTRRTQMHITCKSSCNGPQTAWIPPSAQSASVCTEHRCVSNESKALVVIRGRTVIRCLVESVASSSVLSTGAARSRNSAKASELAAQDEKGFTIVNSRKFLKRTYSTPTVNDVNTSPMRSKRLPPGLHAPRAVALSQISLRLATLLYSGQMLSC